jgi:hypothetical protein
VQVFALNGQLPLDPGANREQVLKAISGRASAAGELVGTFNPEIQFSLPNGDRKDLDVTTISEVGAAIATRRTRCEVDPWRTTTEIDAINHRQAKESANPAFSANHARSQSDQMSSRRSAGTQN